MNQRVQKNSQISKLQKSISRFLKFLLFLTLLQSCVDTSIIENQLPQVDYFIEKATTGSKENRLFLFATEPGMQIELISVTGSPSASVSMDEIIPIPTQVTFSYELERTYEVDLRIFLSDGTLYQEDRISWKYSTAAPPEPIVGFNEKASNDETVIILVSGNRGGSTTDLWIEGDLAEEDFPGGSWREIPSTGMIPLKLSDGDGLKSFTVKTRNIYQNETDPKEISIIRKAAVPENCSVTIEALTTNSSFVRVKVEGTDEYDLQWRVYGDVYNDSQFHDFTNEEIIDISFTDWEGEKDLTVQIRDIADNYCFQEKFVYTYDKDYTPYSIVVNDDDYYTNSELVNVELSYDSLPDDNLEMYIYGNISDDFADTWIPYSESFTVNLDSFEGNRFVRVKFRENDVITAADLDAIYLRPYVYIQGTSAPYNILASNITGLESLTITGCTTSYNNVAHVSAGYSCTPAGATVQVEYFFTDGSSYATSKDF